MKNNDNLKEAMMIKKLIGRFLGVLFVLLLPFGCGSDVSVSECDSTSGVVLGCTPTPPVCVPDFTEVFIWATAGTTNGSRGGIVGANAFCTAGAAGLALPPGSTWNHRAIVSDGTQDARTLMNNCSGPITRVDNTRIAATWGDFFDPNQLLTNPVATVGTAIWTGIDATGSAAIPEPANSCNDWTSNGVADSGRTGNALRTNRRRFTIVAIRRCNLNRRWLCVSYR